MKILVTGGHGQLGRALVRRGVAAGHEVTAHDRDLDIRDRNAVQMGLARIAPEVVINAAAYTAVDKAEDESALAFAINATGAENLARACNEQSVPLVHVSTDYVFDGNATTPYREDDPIAPLGVYGASKAAGERAVHAAGATVVRTSWLFEQDGPSFVHTMLRLARERETLRVVDDQHGCPTWADDLADALLALAALRDRDHTYHFCNEPATTWHRFAVAIVDEGRRYASFTCQAIEPITTAQYPTRAVRPHYSVLDTTRIRSLGITPPTWQAGMARVVAHVLGGSAR